MFFTKLRLLILYMLIRQISFVEVEDFLHLHVLIISDCNAENIATIGQQI